MANVKEIYPGQKLFCKSLKFTERSFGTCEEMEKYINNFVTVIRYDSYEDAVEVQKPNDSNLHDSENYYMLDNRDLVDPKNFARTIETKNLPKIQSSKKARFNPDLLVL